MARVFENPSNGYRDSVDWTSGVATFFFGMFYFAAKGIWRHFVIMTLVILALFMPMGFAAIVVAWIPWLIYACLTPDILANDYLRRGWKEVPGDNNAGNKASLSSAYWDQLGTSPLSAPMPPPTSAPLAKASIESETKVCPACAETIKAAAKICRFCRYEFDRPATS